MPSISISSRDVDDTESLDQNVENILLEPVVSIRTKRLLTRYQHSK